MCRAGDSCPKTPSQHTQNLKLRVRTLTRFTHMQVATRVNAAADGHETGFYNPYIGNPPEGFVPDGERRKTQARWCKNMGASIFKDITVQFTAHDVDSGVSLPVWDRWHVATDEDAPIKKGTLVHMSGCFEPDDAECARQLGHQKVLHTLLLSNPPHPRHKNG